MERTMAKVAGRSIALTPFRRLVTDLMRFSQQVPSVTAERRMDLSPLMAARAVCAPRPSWTVLFTKAFALLGRHYPELRQSYLKFPWPRLYENPHSVCTLNVEREAAGESVVIYCLLRAPENRSVLELDRIVQRHRHAPLEELRSYQRAVAVSHIPWPLRHWFWWAALNVFGRRRCHNFGTFCVTSVAGQGAGLVHLIPLLTSTLHYGLFDEAGKLDMRLSWDHRVMDGVTVARALVDLEQVLNRDIAGELRDLSRRAA
jgi:hypothetical protein